MHALAFPQPRHKRVDRTEADQRHPAERTGMDVADGPVGVMRQRVDRADGHERAFERGQAVEHRRHHHEAKRRVVAHLVPGAVERQQRIGGGNPGRHQQHDREGHAKRLHPLRQRRVMEVVRARPHVEEGDPPETDDRHPVGIDRPVRPFRQVVIEHAEEAGGEEEGDGIVAVPPLHHRVLDARPDRIGLGAGERHRHRQIVDDVEHGDDKDEGEIIPVGDVDVRFLAAGERAKEEQQIGHPDDDQPEVGIPFGLGIFLALADAHEIAADREQAEQVVAEQHEPGTELVR